MKETESDGYTRNFNLVFESELELLRPQAKHHDKDQDGETAGAIPNASKYKFSGLSLSGGGIRSATFNLGLLQALSRLERLDGIDYLSTVSGGGYIGCSLTTLLDSYKQEDVRKEILDPVKFPFSNKYKPKENRNSTSAELYDTGEEKKPVWHLRYYSNYLTAAGNFIDKYIRPLMVTVRGITLNFILMVPYILTIGLLLSLFFFKIPADFAYEIDTGMLQMKLNLLNLDAYRDALDDLNGAKDALKTYVLKHSPELSNLSYDERLEVLSSMKKHSAKITAMVAQIETKEGSFIDVSRSAWRVPLALFIAMVFLNMIFLALFSKSFKSRFGVSRFLCPFLFLSLGLLAVNLFGVALVRLKIPPEAGFISLLSFLAPKLLAIKENLGNNEKKSWVKPVGSILLLALAPLFFLFLIGVVINAMIPAIGYLGVLIIAVIIFLISELININKISLHNFYRDRLSQAYLMAGTATSNNGPDLFDDIKHNDHLKMSDLYEKQRPYHIINCNLNLTKELPPKGHYGEPEAGTFRKGDSFFFSRNWCGSKKTGYQATAAYEKTDPHLDMGTAMAISGAAVNIGMGGNMPYLRSLLALLNIRLGYWAPLPRKTSVSGIKKLHAKKRPGGLTAIKELFGLYSLSDIDDHGKFKKSRKLSDRIINGLGGEFINLSDGGHFDNIGVYELLRRRCKYIIVGDAEADADMSFQALSYIIRLARIDFGINIDIDISDIRPQKKSGFSRTHCAVGIINYPALNDGTEEEIGYLLYCKSSLTGDEPQHLHEYRTKHPDFPHQSTADQWFDEQQFEVYRELGYHIGKEVFRPVETGDPIKNFEAVFRKLKEFWYPCCSEIGDYFTKHGNELNAIVTHIKNDKDLAFMDAQMFPEWDKLISESKNPPPRQLWLPEDADVIRKGFYVCNLMIQLMENVYLDLNLDKNHDHPDNRGWMNLFRHWTWAGIFQVTWSISACTFGARFQSFCRDRLCLVPGEIDIKDFELMGYTPHTNKDVLEAITYREKDHAGLCEILDEYGRQLLVRIVRDCGVPANRICCFQLIVKYPLDTSLEKKFCFGFALLAKDGKIAFFRIQDHLRDMGLGRKAMTALLLKYHTPQDFSDFDASELATRFIDSDALKKCRDRKPHGELDAFDKDLREANETRLRRMLSSAIYEITGNQGHGKK